MGRKFSKKDLKQEEDDGMPREVLLEYFAELLIRCSLHLQEREQEENKVPH
jgi:hypothetical protein